VGVADPDDDRRALSSLVEEFAGHFAFEAAQTLAAPFVKLFPLHLRPYGQLYAY